MREVTDLQQLAMAVRLLADAIGTVAGGHGGGNPSAKAEQAKAIAERLIQQDGSGTRGLQPGGPTGIT